MPKISFRGAFRALRLLFMEIAECSRQVKCCNTDPTTSLGPEPSNENLCCISSGIYVENSVLSHIRVIYTSSSLSSRLHSFQRQHPVQLGANLSLMQLQTPCAYLFHWWSTAPSYVLDQSANTTSTCPLLKISLLDVYKSQAILHAYIPKNSHSILTH